MKSEILPFSTESEKCVLDAVLQNNKALSLVEFLEPDHFFVPSHRKVFTVMRNMHKQGIEINSMSLFVKMKESFPGFSADVLVALDEITQKHVWENVKVFALDLIEVSKKRSLIELSNSVRDAIYSEGESIDNILKSISAFTEGIEKEDSSKKGLTKPCLDFAITLHEDLQDRADNPPNGEVDLKRGIPTELKALDYRLGGLRYGHYDILAGRPGMGKTSVAVQWIWGAAINHKIPSLLYSLEMPGESIVQKMLSQASMIKNERMEKPHLLEGPEWDKLFLQTTKIKESKELLFINDETRKDYEIIKDIKKMVKEKNIKFVVIDYIQKVVLKENKSLTRDLAIGAFSTELANLAKTLKINILILSQLNRGVESRSDKRPMMGDLRESGNLEQDAWRIMLLYRDEYYDQNSEAKGIIDVEIVKNKIGKTGSDKFAFLAEYTLVKNLSLNGQNG